MGPYKRLYKRLEFTQPPLLWRPQPQAGWSQWGFNHTSLCTLTPRCPPAQAADQVPDGWSTLDKGTASKTGEQVSRGGCFSRTLLERS